MLAHLDRTLLVVGVAHLLIGVVALVVVVVARSPTRELWQKAAKFGVSIAAFLLSLAVVVPQLSASPATKFALASTLSLTMVAEMTAIVWQAFRRQPSHFNVSDSLSRALWGIMLTAIVIATLAMSVMAVIATAGPLQSADQTPLPPLLATAWRLGLWLFLVAAVSGFSMGGRSQHSVGGPDGGKGLPVTGWSRRHGDLRVSHFFSMHALQVLPILAAASLGIPCSDGMRWFVVLGAAAAIAAAALITLAQAFAGRPLLR